MNPFQAFSSPVVPIPHPNIDTDQIIPARYLKVTDKAGLTEGLFHGWRYQADGSPQHDFVLNRPAARAAQILLAGDNFGCGSSREHAPWALLGWGFRAIVSTSFADIFRNNALKNGLLPVVVDADTLAGLFAWLEEDPHLQVKIDLHRQTLELPGRCQVTFPIDPFSKACLLEGLDELGYLRKFEAQIAAYEQQAETGEQ